MHLWKAIVASHILFITLVGCQANQTKVIENKPVSNVQTDTIKTYVHPTEQYRLELPKEWANVKIEESDHATRFIYPSTQPNMYQLLFSIEVMTQEEWKRLRTEGSGWEQFKEITTDQGKVYSYLTPLDVALEGGEREQYIILANQIPSIIQSFLMDTKEKKVEGDVYSLSVPTEWEVSPFHDGQSYVFSSKQGVVGGIDRLVHMKEGAEVPYPDFPETVLVNQEPRILSKEAMTAYTFPVWKVRMTPIEGSQHKEELHYYFYPPNQTAVYDLYFYRPAVNEDTLSSVLNSLGWELTK
ncbi:hypothetical protein [Ammoniphilus sp. CFH 90114]|uniref:hypothetical protein n=1 Tax=Ammoniphilus sp. CFH 90114 TaxID=2493665 RepID=UPI00100ECECD|nr:hypothetical protein [Ammoniphilus sp. CFH 90114]RXT07016.1 hypothetical protein EIZ39_12725 [Ammoniphilus sp. CFH 90114]